MGKQHPPIRQGLVQIRKLHERAMGRQRRQGLLQPRKPLLKVGVDGKAATELAAQNRRCLQRELPAAAPRHPLPARPHGPELGLGDGVERQLHLNATRRTQTDQAAGRRW